MPRTRAGPPIAPVIHRSLVTGLLMLTGVMVVFKSSGMAAVVYSQSAGNVLTAVSFVILAVALLFLKPRVPLRARHETVEDYWSAAAPRVLPMWFVMEGAGLCAIAAYYLTSGTIAALAIGISIGAFIWYGPRAFVDT